MGSFSGLAIGLSFVFGLILLGLVAKLYYLLWWKKRISNREIDDSFSNYGAELSYLFCWKKPTNSLVSRQNSSEGLTNSLGNNNNNPQEGNDNGHGSHELDLELGSTEKDLSFKGFGEEGVESELMRLHNLCGPPRFLFTIKEETKEDLESDDGKSRKGSRTRSLSDLILAVENNNTPLSSPPLKVQYLDSYNHQGFNPLFESMSEAELNRLRSSPPPKFKFLRDAEEKLIKKLVEEADKKSLKNGGNVQDSGNLNEEKEGSFIALIARNKEREMMFRQQHSTALQVLPLASSPSTFRPNDNKSSMR